MAIIKFKTFNNAGTTPAPTKQPAAADPDQGVRVVRLKDFLGGGSYTVGPDRNKVYALPRGYGGIPSEKSRTGKERDHIFPVSLGGSSQADNIRLTPNNPADFERRTLEEYEQGKITLGGARVKVITHKQQLEDPLKTKTSENFIPALKETLKRVLVPFGGKKNSATSAKPMVFAVGEGLDERQQQVAREVVSKPSMVRPDLIRSAAEAFPRLAGSFVSEITGRPIQIGRGEPILPVSGLFAEAEEQYGQYGPLVAGLSMVLDADPRLGGGTKKTVLKEFGEQILKKADTGLAKTLFPLKSQPGDVQVAFKQWLSRKLVGREMANEAVSILPSAGKHDWQAILDYQAGKPNQAIADAFDDIFDEATDRGLKLPYRTNYLPQIYKNEPAEIDKAVAAYMRDQGVADDTVKQFLDGKDIPEDLARRLKLNASFTNKRVFPDYATALKYGLKPRYTNAGQLLAHYRQEMENTLANRDFLDSLVTNGRLVPAEAAGRDFKPITLAFSSKGYYAEPGLARMLNGLFRDEGNLSFGERLIQLAGEASKKAQEITLSGGIPKTSFNFFSLGQAIKEITSGNFKAIPAFLRSQSNSRSLQYFIDNQDTLQRMARQGVDLGDRLGSFESTYKNLVANRSLKELAGDGFNKLFNEKTFASFIPQMQLQTFKDAMARGMAKGMTEDVAEDFAAQVTRNAFGLMEATARGKGTEDAISAVFFAPKFREGIINTFINAAKSVTTEVRNPAFYRNRRLVAGMAVTYAAYNALNKHLNGTYMWENEPGHESELKITLDNGDVVYVPFMPSFLAFARNMLSGTIAVGQGDFDTAGQKFGSLFSMPVKLASELLSNKDYFGRKIYDNNDPTDEKLQKSGEHIFLSVNHPFVREWIKGKQSERPLYQTLSMMMELPVKYSSLDKVSQNEFYESMRELDELKAKRKKAFQPMFDKIMAASDEEAQALLDRLSEEDYTLFKSMQRAEKTKNTQDGIKDLIPVVQAVRALEDQGRIDEAQAIVDALSEEDYRLYKLAKQKVTP